MAEEKNAGGNFSLTGPGIIALALAVFGLIWSGPSPLIDERPFGQHGSVSNKGKIQDIDARMWQDPLGAVIKEVRLSTPRQRSVQLQSSGNELKLIVLEEKPAGKSSHSPKDTIHKAFRKNRAGIHVLAVMIPGGPYPEEEEGRRRRRYAVLSGLASRGFAPVDTEHIGYFEPDSNKDVRLPGVVPFEIFRKESDYESPSNKLTDKVVVLWLDDGYFSKKIESKINNLFDQAIPDCTNYEDKSDCTTKQNIPRVVIGPSTSDQLYTLIDESKEKASSTQFIDAGATLDLGHFPIGVKIENKLLRAIGDDQATSKALVNELQIRHIKPVKDHVLLISEWDTLYGRSLPDTFIKEYVRGKNDAADKTKCLSMDNFNQNMNGNPQSNVHCVNYMRGIDGKLPDNSGTADSEPVTSTKDGTIQINNNIDRPSGNNQKDYLRRLVDQVRKLDANIKNSRIPCPVKNNGISAIGILGSDVYDKLMILQALRPYFPGKIFFTTDLDAAFFSPSELPYTHNLIVGSSFGLSLAPELQKSIPPFRDSYQTSTFLSTLLAVSQWGLDKNIQQSQITGQDGWLNKPRIFEIGRNGAVDLSEGNLPNKSINCAEDLSACDHIHPDPDISSSKTRSISFLKLFSLVLGFVLLYRMSWTSRWLPTMLQNKVQNLESKIHPVRTHTNSDEPNNGPANRNAKWNLLKTCALHPIVMVFSMLPLVLSGLIIIGIVYLTIHSAGIDEPFYWFNGVSIWPSILLVIFALGMSLWFNWRSHVQLEEVDRHLGKDFCLALSEQRKTHRIDWSLNIHNWEHKDESQQVQVEQLWLEYRNKYGNPPSRFFRTTINTIIFTLFGLTAVMLSGGLPVPARGHSFYIDIFFETTCVIAVVFLIMWVVDTARLFSKFMEHLASDRETNWSDECVKNWGQDWPDEHVMNWIDLQFVAQYTKAIEKFIWYPIPPLLLMGLARSSLFDNWTFSAGLLASIAVLLLYLFSIAFLLQYRAKEMRAKTVEQIGERLRKLRGLRRLQIQTGNEDIKIAQLEKMMGEINGIVEGAFTPFLHQPMVQALLTFLSGSGGLIVLMDRYF